MPTNAGVMARAIRDHYAIEIPKLDVIERRKLCLDFAIGAMPLAAVDTGRMRYNIRAFADQPEFTDEDTPERNEGPATAEEINRILTALADLSPFGTCGVTCGVEYASYVEDGTDRMAAQPFFGPQFARIERQVFG